MVKGGKHMTNISCDTQAASLKKYDEACPIRIEIYHINSTLSLFYHGSAIQVALFNRNREGINIDINSLPVVKQLQKMKFPRFILILTGQAWNLRLPQ